MKRVAVIFFLSLFLIQVGGCYLYFVGRLVAIRAEMRERLKFLPEEQLSRFQFTPKEFLKVREDDHEIKVDGKMYDIARVSEQANQIIVWALHDEAEDNLLAFLSEMVSRSAKDKKPVPVQVEQLLTLSFLPPPFMVFQNRICKITHQTPYNKMCSAFFSTLESPPPRG
ncbi:MAG: hypothetical protein UZ12_BCD005001604 [Bacteroidetes bacterium OLB12]|nr:MAG: hypothetical protein UZ12_BCD005001604 [Bacteroidetes bacterium OLB12]